MRVKFYYSSRLARKNKKPDYMNQHTIPFPKLVSEVIRTSDIVLEVLDARFIDKTRNNYLEKEVLEKGKKLIYVLNKADLVKVKDLKLNYDFSSIKPYVLFSSKSRIGRARLKELIKIEASKVKRNKVRVGIIGYPNTGKSSLINLLAKRKRAGISPQAGFTKAIQKIKFSKDILILDSPGIIPAKDENSPNPSINKKHTLIGVSNYDKVKNPDFVVLQIMQENSGILDKFYSVDADDDVELLLDILGKRWNYVKKKGEFDHERVARRILKDWQEGKIKK